jgi:hypothetical protein
MRIAKNISLVVFSTLLTFGVALSAFAQSDNSYLTNPAAIRDNDINVDLIPAVPGPKQNVKINLSSFATDINKATITWTIDGKESLSGIGKRTFSFTTGDIGSTTVIKIAIIVAEGGRVDKQITIQPSQVDLLWEAPDAYVPPFYKGKALSIKEGKVKIVALPIEADGSINPTNKVYNWKKNFIVDQSNSGYGKYSFVVRNSYLDPTDSASVNVSGSTGSGSTGTITLAYSKPQIMIYENSSAFGLRLNKLLNGGFSLGNGEIGLSAEPFYFSKTKGTIVEKNMQYKWVINGTTVTPPETPNKLTVRGSAQEGTANVSLTITNISTLFQEAKQTMSITLGK